MDSDKRKSFDPGHASGVLVGRSVTIRAQAPEPAYYTGVHRGRVGQTGRVHAIVAGSSRNDPLVKVGFEEGTSIVFFRLRDLDVHEDASLEQRRHGKRGTHLPGT